MFYEAVLARQWLVPIDRQPPFWTDIDVRGSRADGLFPNLDPHIDDLALGPQAIHAIDKNLLSPYTMQTSLAVQQLITPRTVAEIGYTFTRGVHLSSRADMAIPQPILQPDGRWFFPEPSNEDAPLLNPEFSRLEWYSSGSYSNYHGLRTSVSHSTAAGLQLQANYTFSKAMDTLSAHISGELGDSGVQNGFDIPGNYGLADFHVAHNFSSNFNYALPIGQGRMFGSGMGPVANAILGGWQVSGVFSAQSGTPLSVSGNEAFSHERFSGSRPDLAPGGDINPTFDEQVPFPGGPGLLWFDGSTTNFVNQGLGPDGEIPSGFYGNLGRNTVIGPGLVSMDFSLLKNFSWGEERDVQFRAEFFNLFNTPQFSQPSADITSSNVGRIDSAIENSARQVQLALRLTF